MPRRARITVPGIPWHIIQRGNNRSACFYTESDYRYYLCTLGEQAEKYGCAIHAYVMMTNHVHLLCTPQHENSAALLMKNLGQRYVQYINRTYRRSGTLWEGRFKSCLAQSETYVMTCYRYIELNPVRAGMVYHPRDYRWSSYRANAEGGKDSVLTPHSLYMQLGQNEAQRESAYRGQFNMNLDSDQITAIRDATNGNYALGDGRFQQEIEKMLRRRVAPGKSGRPAKSGTG
ncbi:transposase [Pseudomonadota bacterium]